MQSHGSGTGFSLFINRSAIEIENFGYVKEILNRDFNSWSGKFLEKYFIEKLKLEKNYSLIGN